MINAGFITLFEREIKRFMKVVMQTVVTPFVSSFLYLLVFGVTLGAQVQVHGDVPYLAFLIPGLMMMGLMNNAFQNASSSIVSSKFSGDLEDIRVAPISNQQIVWAMSFGSVVRGALVALVTYVVGTAFYYLQRGELLAIQHPFILLYFVVMGGLIFGMIGISVAFWASSFDQLSVFSAFVLLPLTYLGGVFISIESLPAFWQMLAKLNPLLYLINGLRYGMLGVSDVEVTQAVILSLVGFAVFYGVSLWSLRKGSFQRW